MIDTSLASSSHWVLPISQVCLWSDGKSTAIRNGHQLNWQQPFEKHTQAYSQCTMTPIAKMTRL